MIRNHNSGFNTFFCTLFFPIIKIRWIAIIFAEFLFKQKPRAYVPIIPALVSQVLFQRYLLIGKSLKDSNILHIALHSDDVWIKASFNFGKKIVLRLRTFGTGVAFTGSSKSVAERQKHLKVFGREGITNKVFHGRFLPRIISFVNDSK